MIMDGDADLGFARAFGDDSDLHFLPVSRAAAISTKALKAGRAAVKEPKLQPEIQQATDRPQPVGAVEPGSGRVVSQPTDNPAINQALATDAMREYRAGLQSIALKIPGAKLAASRDAKNPRRLAEKIEREGQPAETVSDYGAAQVSVSTPQARDAMIEAVKKKFPVVRQQDNFSEGDPECGYRSYSMQLRMPNGASLELQIVPKEVFAINRIEHKEYKAARNSQLAGGNADRLKAEARKLNDAAMAKFNSRNGLGRLAKGSAVTLADGSGGIISYLDPNMRIVRVRTENGRNVTVRQGQLKIAQ